MRSCRVTLTGLLILAAVILSVPVTAIAAGPSAGDNQYTDPLAGQGNHHGSGGSQTPTGSTPQTPVPSTSSSSPAAITASSSSSATSNSTPGSAGTTTLAASSSRTLPNTGFEPGLAGAIGASMIGIGLVTRRRIRCSSR